MKELKEYGKSCIKSNNIKWPKNKKLPIYFDEENLDRTKFSKSGLIDSFGYHIQYEKINDQMDIVEDDLSPDEFDFHFERWILFKQKDRFGILISSESNAGGGQNIVENSDYEFEFCESTEDILNLRNHIHDKIIWKNSSKEMIDYLSSEEVLKLPWI